MKQRRWPEVTHGLGLRLVFLKESQPPTMKNGAVSRGVNT